MSDEVTSNDEVEIISINENEIIQSNETIQIDDVINKLKESLPDCFIIPPQIGENVITVSDKQILGNVIEITVDDWKCSLKKEKDLDVKHLVMRLPDGRVINSDSNTITVKITSEIIKEKEIKTISDLDPIIEKFKETDDAK
jgi:hypothetical protein